MQRCGGVAGAAACLAGVVVGVAAASVPHCALRKSFHFMPFSVLASVLPVIVFLAALPVPFVAAPSRVRFSTSPSAESEKL